MLTQFFKSINWIDVTLIIFFIRTVYVSVKSGFVAEGCRFFGTLCALFISLHFYSALAGFLATKFKLSLGTMEFFVFVFLWALVTVFFMLLYRGIILLFKIEANHQLIDKYAAGFLGATRAIFLTSLAVFALLLTHHPYFSGQTFMSNAYAFMGKAAPNTYCLGYNTFIGKVFEGQQFNEDVFAVISRHGVNPK